MVIGNFNTSENTSSNYLGNWGDNGSFYYIDEVCLSSLSTECVSLVASINNLDEDDKKLLQIVDSLGRNCKKEYGKLLFYIYDDGSIEKHILIE
jgi:hypothetical protein